MTDRQALARSFEVVSEPIGRTGRRGICSRLRLPPPTLSASCPEPLSRVKGARSAPSCHTVMWSMAMTCAPSSNGPPIWPAVSAS